jgi:hypothetical protein
MTKNEFRAWFDGFCEGMEGAPNDKQWERIKARVAEINDVATTYPVFVDRYVAPYRPYWTNVPYWDGNTSGPVMSAAGTAPIVLNATFDMKDAGRAEYRAVLNS